jgi:ABC-type Co2+ transport system permease subunit
MDLKTWFLSLGQQYGVNPIIFGSIYVGAIPFFTLSIAWLVKNIRRKKSIVLPVLSAGFFFISAYLYLIIVGRNIPSWVYVMIAVLVGYGAWSTYSKVKTKATALNVPSEGAVQ